MREIRTSGLMSGDGKRSDCQKAQATASILDSTKSAKSPARRARLFGVDGMENGAIAKRLKPPRPSSTLPLQESAVPQAFRDAIETVWLMKT